MTDDTETTEAGEASLTVNGVPLDLNPDGIAGASTEELTLALETFQQTVFPSWAAKALAAEFQRRLDNTLKGRN